MDGFKTLPKMQHFKEGGHAKAKEMCWGGSAKKKMKTGGEVEHEDAKEDKKMIKKAFGMHDKQLHEEKTDLSGLKKGGRSKKATGTVRKYKDGGSVTNVYEAKKKSGDIDNIQKVKDIKPGKATAPSKAAEKPALRGSDVEKEKNKPAGDTKAKKVSEDAKAANAPSGAKGGPNKYKTGGGVKKMQAGSLTGRLSDYVMGTPAQNAQAQKEIDAYRRRKAMERAQGVPQGMGANLASGLANIGSGQPQDMGQPQPQPEPQQPTALPQQKRGGRAGKKSCR